MPMAAVSSLASVASAVLLSLAVISAVTFQDIALNLPEKGGGRAGVAGV